MGSFRLGGMTLGSLFKKPETLLYPAQEKEPPSGLKGHVVNDVAECIACGICQRVCPADAIAVDKKARTWSIDPFRCVQCGSCVGACPQHCLAMEPSYTPVSAKQYAITLDIPERPKKARASEGEEGR